MSDLHLAVATPKTTRAFVEYLRVTPADAVVILGDLFEVWIGDDIRHDPWERALIEALADASRRTVMAFMVGNRDFLVGDDLLAAAGLQPLADPSCIELFGQRLLLSHGDALCLADAPYQAFRRMVRSREWQLQCLAQPLDERRRIAAQVRGASNLRRQFDGEMNADVDTTEALRWLEAAHADVLVHGHTHKPGEHRLRADGPQRRIVLSDWDLDHDTRPRAEVLRWTAGGLARHAVR